MHVCNFIAWFINLNFRQESYISQKDTVSSRKSIGVPKKHFRVKSMSCGFLSVPRERIVKWRTKISRFCSVARKLANLRLNLHSKLKATSGLFLGKNFPLTGTNKMKILNWTRNCILCSHEQSRQIVWSDETWVTDNRNWDVRHWDVYVTRNIDKKLFSSTIIHKTNLVK